MRSFNPIKFANDVNTRFLNYQHTAFPLSDPDLSEQAKKLLKGGVDFQPLIKGPYLSISKSFKWGRNLKDLAEQGLVHQALPGLAEFPQMFIHQDKALDSILKGKHCLISTGTGSGKTESFLYPIFNHCLKLRDDGAPEGVVAILVYPMNALAMDQLYRLRSMLAGSGISFGMYIGTTAADQSALRNVHRMQPNEGKKEYKELAKRFSEDELIQISPPEERITENEISKKPPRILLTNVKQLELLLTRAKDIQIFHQAPLKYLVFDEAHTYSGIAGAEVSCLIRRLRAISGKTSDEVISIGTSATIVDPELGEEAGKIFAQRFFGINADKIELIQEEYEEEEFPKERYKPNLPSVDAVELLDNILSALEKEDNDAISEAYYKLTGKLISDKNDITLSLYNSLKENEYIYQVFNKLTKPLSVKEAVNFIQRLLARTNYMATDQTSAEMLCYLTLGASAQKEGNPLLRPKIHYFVKGLEGAVVGFDKDQNTDERNTRLFLSKEKAIDALAYDDKAFLPILVCKTCGQHYFEGYYRDFTFDHGKVSGGQAEGDNTIWTPADEQQEYRVLLTDRFVAQIEDEEDLLTDRIERKTDEVYVCSHCGTLQKNNEKYCSNPKCKRVSTLKKLLAVILDESRNLKSCPSCGARSKSSGRIIEPIRPLRAVTVSDVHILAQNMINTQSTDNQKMIVFTDNRQDAAFQAGWMQDHARRYRFRHLIYEYLNAKNSTVSITDIEHHLFEILSQDKNLGLMLAPEVYEFYSDETYSQEFINQLRYFIRIQLIRELGTSFTQKEGLEPWGLLNIVYQGVDGENEWIKSWSEKIGLNTEELASSISSLLDVFRRNRYIFDNKAPIFSRAWREGDREIQLGYLPLIMGPSGNGIPPKGLIEWPDQTRTSYQAYFRSLRGQSLPVNFIKKWNLSQDILEGFLSELWKFFVDHTKILKPIILKTSTNRDLNAGQPVYQIDSSKVGIRTQWAKYHCSLCQRIHSRPTVNNVCTAMHCRGNLVLREPSNENYNIDLLNNPFSMLMAQEHTAQVPAKRREEIEREFKKKSGRFNCLVATPTLELGVDIGALDMVLMRNVPPLASNYWQRAGRAGRRQRLAVVYTYCRRSDHDQYFFEEPLRILEGVISTPKFNMRNEIMLRKHIHATVLSELIKIAIKKQSDPLHSETEIQEVKEILSDAFPTFIKSYLFESDGTYLKKPKDVSSLKIIIKKNEDRLVENALRVFREYWPEEDKSITDPEKLRSFILEMTSRLQEVVNLMHTRMLWAYNTQEKFLKYQNQRLLSPEEEKVLNRCKNFLKDLNRESQDNYTLNVLSEEGYLPGYGLYGGGIKAFAHQSYVGGGKNHPDFELSRASTIAVREFVPGNMIYANNGRFKVVIYRMTAFDENIKGRKFLINLEKGKTYIKDLTENSSIQYSGSNLHELSASPISDCDVHYISRISDEELNRFQMPVTLLGELKRSRRGGSAYKVGDKEIKLLIGQSLQLVNVGPVDQSAKGKLGYPICTVCGGTRSPYSSDAELNHFRDMHSQRCGKEPVNIGLFAEAKVDGILIKQLESQSAAANLAEGIIVGSNLLLEMERGDLGYVIIQETDETFSLFIYDPMPGGSGLLNQIIGNWDKVINVSIGSLVDCPNKCETSCYSCLRTYYNVFNHSLLDRIQAQQILSQYSGNPIFNYDIPAEEEVRHTETNTGSTNIGEKSLGTMLVEAGLPKFQEQVRISIGPPYHSTVPDLYFEDSVNNLSIAIYLDGLSREIHGNAERRRMDLIVRNILESKGIKVIEIASSDLNDPEIMNLHIIRISGLLNG